VIESPIHIILTGDDVSSAAQGADVRADVMPIDTAADAVSAVIFFIILPPFSAPAA
jgi:hypothetical protein